MISWDSVLKYLVMLVISTCSHFVLAQIADCSQCDTVQYTEDDFIDTSITKLQLLRNEIFARHQYVFKNDRLLEYFQEQDWYQPNFKSPVKNVKLNSVETSNVNLLLALENGWVEWRERLETELNTLKKALHKNELDTIRMYIGEVIAEENYKYLKGFSQVFDKIELRDLNWYNDRALFQVKVDNGFFVKVTELRITGERVVVMQSHQEHSEIIEKPFQFGSEYYSEDEHATFWIFSFDGTHLRLMEIMEAG